MKHFWMWAIGILLTIAGITLLILKPVWFVLLVGVGVILFLAFILLIDYIGPLFCKHR